MPARAGERAEKAATFQCVSCSEIVRVHEGQRIPKCPNGHRTFGEPRVDAEASNG
jgi:hypothetical protein